MASSSAAPPPAAVIESMEAMGVRVTHVYGLTEVYGPAVVNDWHNEWNALDASGRAAKKARQGVRYHALEDLAVLDPDTMERMPPGMLGEVMFRGNVVMKGYLKNEAATRQAFAGGSIDNWYAPNITSDTKEGIGAWSNDKIVAYLKKGAAQGKGAAFGPMAQTVHDSLSHLTDADLQDIAVYLKTIPPKHTYHEAKMQTAYVHDAGVQIYLTNCASCHQPNGKGLGDSVPNLAGNGAVTAKGAEHVVRAILGGLPAQETYGPMPGFATVLSTQQIADVANYVRTSWGNGAPANATQEMVASLTPKTETMMAGDHWCTNPGHGKLADAINNPSSGIASDMQQINQTTLVYTAITEKQPQTESESQ